MRVKDSGHKDDIYSIACNAVIAIGDRMRLGDAEYCKALSVDPVSLAESFRKGEKP